MLKKFSVFVLMIATLLTFFIFSAYDQGESQETNKDEVYYNKAGLSHFNEGFYKLRPKGMKEEALESYKLAIIEFKKAVAANEGHVEAHLNLARVYSVQHKFPEAAKEYKRVTELAPHNIDTYVKLAIVYGRMNKYSEAIERLEKAKTFTNKAVVLNQLDNYIKKLEHVQQRQSEETGGY